MLILIRCDGTSSRIILKYYYKITSLFLLHYINQVKSGNTEGSMNRQEKWGEKNLILWDKTHSLLFLPEFSIFYILFFFIFIIAH